MPNRGHIWTEQEEQAALAMSWEEFNESFNGKKGLDISYDAFRLRKSALKRGTVTQMAPRVEVDAAPDGEYVGFDIGFWDLETTFSSQPRILCGAIANNAGEVEVFRREDYPGEDAIDDGPLANAIARALEKYQIVAGWNSKLFDQPVLNGRLMFHGLPIYRPTMHLDLMYYASGSSARIGRRSLQSVSEFFNSPHRKTPLDVRTWDRAVSGDKEAYELIVEHNVADVLVTRDVFRHLKPGISVLHR